MARAPETQPRISLNKLCEFMTASPSRQRRIVRDQKYPSDFMRVYYREAQEAVAHCIASGLEDFGRVERQIEILNQMTPDSIGTQRRITANIEALETFLQMVDTIDLAGAEPRLGENAPPRLAIRNVDVSVRPEVLLSGQGRNGRLVGGIKLHFPRTNRLDERAAGYVSAVLQEWCSRNLADEGQVSGPMCYVIDIGSQRAYAGVRATAQRIRDIEDACATIHALWPTIGPD